MPRANETRTEALRFPSLRRDPARSYGASKSENMLLHADNLVAMRWLRARFASRFRCVYLDPPFNTGRTFAEYDDRFEPAAWRHMIEARLAAAHALLADDGAIFVEIDDTELAHLQLAMDAVFGRHNRVSLVTIVRSAGTGHKAKNRGPVNVTDYLLVYAKDKSKWRCNALTRVRRDYDRAYSTWLTNRQVPPAEWKFVPLAEHAARALSVKKVTRVDLERFAIDHAESVVRFAQPRYDAVSNDARALIDRSRREPQRVLVLPRANHKDMILRGGNRVLFLADKVRVDESTGARAIVEPLTNVWDDLPFQGIAKEGGVVFVRNKKPERLVARVLAMATDRGDWVLDPFLGSGTTTAVAHKMGRRWVGIERADTMDTLCLPRMRHVVDGADPTGVTRAMGWKGGGGFHVHA